MNAWRRNRFSTKNLTNLITYGSQYFQNRQFYLPNLKPNLIQERTFTWPHKMLIIHLNLNSKKKKNTYARILIDRTEEASNNQKPQLPI